MTCVANETTCAGCVSSSTLHAQASSISVTTLVAEAKADVYDDFSITDAESTYTLHCKAGHGLAPTSSSNDTDT